MIPDEIKTVIFSIVIIAFVIGIIWLHLKIPYSCADSPWFIDHFDMKREIERGKTNSNTVLGSRSCASESADAGKKEEIKTQDQVSTGA
ncbi:MAG: hypothetical protein AB8G05_01310 [Oligoflexales bacterium]